VRSKETTLRGRRRAGAAEVYQALKGEGERQVADGGRQGRSSLWLLGGASAGRGGGSGVGSRREVQESDNERRLVRKWLLRRRGTPQKVMARTVRAHGAGLNEVSPLGRAAQGK